MATTKVYTKASASMMGSSTAGNAPNIDWLSDNIYIGLCTSSYSPSQTADEFWSTPVANESTGGTGYTTNGALLGTKTLVNAGSVTTIGAASPAAWVASGGGFAAAYAVIYDRTPGSDATRPLIAYIDFGGTKTLAAGDTLTITFTGGNIATWTVS